MFGFWPFISISVASFVATIGSASAGSNTVPQDGDMISWVILSPSYQKFNLHSLRMKLNVAFPGKFPASPGKNEGFVVEGPSPGRFMIKSTVSGASGLFLLHNVPAPYRKFSGMIDAIPDSDLRRFALAQCCWLSIDAITKTANGPEAYRFIGVALAQLATDDAAVLLHPTRPIAMSLDPLNRQRLAAGLQPD